MEEGRSRMLEVMTCILMHLPRMLRSERAVQERAVETEQPEEGQMVEIEQVGM